MLIHKMKSIMKQYWIFYLIGFLLVLGIKFYYSKADSNALDWILAPTAWWVRVLSGIPFDKQPHTGYVNHEFRFIIASSCSGIQFMMITIATLIYSYVHRMKTRSRGFIWIAFCVGISYLFTIFINGFRIVLSIYFPLYFYKADVYNKWLTPEKLHTIIGTVVYFSSLFAIYHIAGYVSQIAVKKADNNAGFTDSPLCDTTSAQILHGCLPPLFWYFFIVLGIPFLNRAYQNNGKQFWEYTLLMSTVCLAVTVVFCLGFVIYKHTGHRRK